MKLLGRASPLFAAEIKKSLFDSPVLVIEIGPAVKQDYDVITPIMVKGALLPMGFPIANFECIVLRPTSTDTYDDKPSAFFYYGHTLNALAREDFAAKRLIMQLPDLFVRRSRHDSANDINALAMQVAKSILQLRTIKTVEIACWRRARPQKSLEVPRGGDEAEDCKALVAMLEGSYKGWLKSGLLN